MSEDELTGILDAIKALTGEYTARGTETEYDSKNFGKASEYKAELTRDDVAGILQALSAQPAYRPMPEYQDSMDFEAEVMRRYPQFFGVPDYDPKKFGKY